MEYANYEVHVSLCDDYTNFDTVIYLRNATNLRQLQFNDDFCHLQISCEIPNQFFMVTEELSWLEEEQYCNDQYGSNLASIHNVEENEIAQQLCNKYCWECFIGYTDTRSEGSFYWIDNSFNKHYNWAYIQPDNALGVDGEENCVTISSVTGHWNDDACCESYCFLCNAANPTTNPTSQPTNTPTQAPDAHPLMKNNWASYQLLAIENWRITRRISIKVG